MNRRNRNKSRSERGKPSFKATAKAKAFSPRKTRLSKNDKKKLVETVKAEVAESSKSKPKEKKQGSATTQNTMNLRLTEHGAGITEYISKHEGFSAIIKQRYSDFHVNEIDCDGNIVTLTTLKAPEAPVAAAAETKEEVDDYLKTTLPEEQYKKLMELVESNGEEVEIEATDMSKDDRRKLHTAIVKYGKSRLISNTVDKDGKKYIVVKRSSKSGKQERRAVPWPADRGGEYVYFILHKENMDTIETVNLIASRLRVKPNMITYAGMKDRRAKTSQLMCVWKVEPQRLVNVSRSLRGIELGNYSFHQRPLRLGDLRGNRFRIVLRNVTGSDKQIEEGLTSLKTKGFLNYYGLQRFGSSLAVPTHEIGKALLLGNWQKAVELILKPRDGEPLRFLAEARKVWWETRDPAKAIKILRNKDKMIEGKLLLGLSRHGPKNYLNALDNIPRNTRLMYLHSYQSFIWNKVVSRRMQKFGLQPIKGDLVLQGEERAEPVELLEVGDHDATATQQTSDTADDNVSNKQKPSVRLLSENDLKDFTIYDVVLPLPGHDIVYPQNETKEWFEELLQADGLSPAKLKQSVRAYSVGGAYRRIAVRPTNVSWKIMHYSDPQTTLMLSDLEEMQKVAPPKDEKDGVYKALILDFCLPSSTYATMAIREVLKSDTSCYNQALLNDYHVSTSPIGTPKRRLSSAENGDSVSSSQSEDMKVETQDQVTSTKHQGSSICTRATKREKKSAEPDGQMEVERTPGLETPGISIPNMEEKEKSSSEVTKETTTLKIEDKGGPSSEVTAETAVVMPLDPLSQSEEIIPKDVDKNEQQLPTPMECGVAPRSGLTDKSVSDMEVAAVEIEEAVRSNDDTSVEKVEISKSAEIEKQNFNLVENSSDESHCEIGKALHCETVTSSAVVCLEANNSKQVSLSDIMDTNTDAVSSTSSVSLKTAAVITPSSAVTKDVGILTAENQCNDKELLAGIKSAVDPDKSVNEKTECKNSLVGTSLSIDPTLSPSESDEVSEAARQKTIGRITVSEGVVMTTNLKPESAVKHECLEGSVQTEEIVLEKSKKTDSDSLPETGVQQTETPELLTQPEKALSSDVKLIDTKTQEEIVQVTEQTPCSDISATSSNIVGTEQIDEMSSCVKREKSKPAELSKETSNEAVTAMIDFKESAALHPHESLVGERTSLPDDKTEVKSQKPNLCTVNEKDQITSDTVADNLEIKILSEMTQPTKALSTEQDCEGNRKLSKEISSEPSVKSNMMKQSVTDIPSVLVCDKSVKVVERVHPEISLKQEKGVGAQETFIAPESVSSSVCVSPEIMKDSVPQLDSQCAVPEVIEKSLTSDSGTSLRSKLVATTEMEENRETSGAQMEKTDAELPLNESDAHNVKESCIKSERRVVSHEDVEEKRGESLQSSEVPTSSTLICGESFVKEKDDDISELSGKASLNQGSATASSLLEKAATKEIASVGVSTTQSSVTAKNKLSLENDTSVFVPDKTDPETGKTEGTHGHLVQSSGHTDSSEQHSVKEKNNDETVELCVSSKTFKVCLVKEDVADCVKQTDQKSLKQNSALLSTSLQPSDEVSEEKVIENSDRSSGTAHNLCSQSSPLNQPKLDDVKCVNSDVDDSSCEKEDKEKDLTPSRASDSLSKEDKGDLQACVKLTVNSATDSQRTEVSIKRKVLEGENETEIGPKKVKVDDHISDTPSVSDAQFSRSPESLKRKSANDDTETNDQESNTEKKKLKVETSE